MECMIHSPNGRALKEKRIVTKTQKGKDIQVQNQGDADRFFWCPWNCPRKIFATRPNC